MKKTKNFWQRLFKFLASLQLAVIVILALAFISAVGTFVEARYDANYAQKLIYHSTAMYFVLGLLCINLFNVIVDRYPWKKHHLGFILAHVGIILLVVGSLVTKLAGIDASLPVDVGQSNRYAVVPAETELTIYASSGSGNFERMHHVTTDFLLHPPQKKPLSLRLGSESIELLEYHYATIPQRDVRAHPKGEVALRIQLQNERVNVVDWLVKDSAKSETALELGPASVLLVSSRPTYRDKNEVYFWPQKDGQTFKYFVFTQSQGGMTKSGEVKAGGQIDLGWMGLSLRLLKHVPRARWMTSYKVVEKPGELTAPVLKFRFRGEDHWIGLNSSLKLFTDQFMYLVSFANRRVNLGFDVFLKNFEVGRYQGTLRAASYASEVKVADQIEARISMNQPLKYGGFTIYQASFQEDETGKPVTSIFSVNYDPGRWVKYLGSLLIVLGTIVMFYFKRKRRFSSKIESQGSAAG